MKGFSLQLRPCALLSCCRVQCVALQTNIWGQMVFWGWPWTLTVVDTCLTYGPLLPLRSRWPTHDFPTDASFPRPISSVSCLAHQLLVHAHPGKVPKLKIYFLSRGQGKNERRRATPVWVISRGKLTYEAHLGWLQDEMDPEDAKQTLGNYLGGRERIVY